MQVSAISNNNNTFGQSMPILKILTLAKNGQEVALRRLTDQQGPMYAFVRKLNNDQYCAEGKFLRQKLSMFRKYPFVSSTSMATDKRYLVFGSEDIDTLRRLCTDHYHTNNLTKEEVMNAIVERLIKPFRKKYRFGRYHGDTVGEPVGLVLHANKVKSPKGNGKVWNFGIDITDETGNHVYAVLPSAVSEVAKLQPKIKLPVLKQAEFNFTYPAH